MIRFKSNKDVKLFSALHPILIMIFADMWNYAHENHGVYLTVTQTITTEKQDKKLHRKSSAHRENRAIDIRTKDLDAFVVQDIQNYINNKKEYLKYHYVSMSGESRLAFWHIGSEQHFHLALHSRFAIKK